MSYSTRSGRQARGPQATQVTFHQQPRQHPNQMQFTHFQPASIPLAQPAPPGASSPQLQQQQQSPQQQQVQQQQTQQFKMQQAPVSTSTVVSPSVAVTPSVATQQPSQTGIQTQPQETSESDAKPWKKLKNPTFKVNRVQKRRRQNARFKKLLMPKNAIMVLNELQPGVTFDAEEQNNAFNQLQYTVRVTIDGETYAGEGTSKAAAKAAAAECAVKGLVLKKIADATNKTSVDGDRSAKFEDEQMDANSADDVSEKGSTNGKKVIPEDDVPWGSLASFALFKLFAQWKSQGTNFPPVISPPVVKPIPKVAGPQPMKGNIPDNPETLHPVTLVGRVFPGTTFVELSREGTPPHLTFCFGATVNDIKYTGIAKSKKEAKKNCAIAILNANNVPYNATI